MTQTMIDCTNAAFLGLVTNLKTYPAVLAGYVTGTAAVDWSAADWAEAKAKCGALRYDQSPGLTLFANGGADAADVESEAGTIAHAVNGAKERQAKGWWSWVYVSAANVPSLDSAMTSNGVTKVQYIVANWNLSEEQAASELGGKVVAIQWASPTSNPNTICPGTDKTLRELNVDLNVTIDGWFAKKTATTPPTQVQASTLTLAVDLKGRKVTSTWK